jgi:hypothetical protein
MIERKGYIYSGIGAKRNEEIAAKDIENIGERLVDGLVERLVENQKKKLELMVPGPARMSWGGLGVFYGFEKAGF